MSLAEQVSAAKETEAKLEADREVLWSKLDECLKKQAPLLKVEKGIRDKIKAINQQLFPIKEAMKAAKASA